MPTRKYPPSDLAAHLFGYVGEVNEAQLARAEYQGIEPGAMVGQAGVEQAYNQLLMGADGDRFVVVNSLGREIARRRTKPPQGRPPLQLTIDADVQRAGRGRLRISDVTGATTARRSCSIRATARCCRS